MSMHDPKSARWPEAVAVGSLAFVEEVKSELGVKALDRELEQIDGTYGCANLAKFTSADLTAKMRL